MDNWCSSPNLQKQQSMKINAAGTVTFNRQDKLAAAKLKPFEVILSNGILTAK